MIPSNLKILWFYESINRFKISYTGTCSFITQNFSIYIDMILVLKTWNQRGKVYGLISPIFNFQNQDSRNFRTNES